ncbi:MAG: hypothetical protein ABI780_12175, partial [Ardenticatenales bacterium]
GAARPVGDHPVADAPMATASPLPTVPMPPTSTAPRPPIATTPTAPPPSSGGIVIPSLPDCTFGGTFDVSSTSVAVGEIVTGTIDIGLSCPDSLRGRAAVVVLGAMDQKLAASVRSALALLVTGLADTEHTSIAFVSAGALAVPPRFQDVAADRPAIDALVAGLGVRTETTSDRYADQLDAVADAFQRLPPSQRPLFVLVDGAAPSGDIDAAALRLRALVGGLRDLVGLGILIDGSPDAWLRGIGQGGAAPEDTLIYVHEAQSDALPDAIASVVDALGAPIDLWQVRPVVSSRFGIEQATLTLLPGGQASPRLPWSGIAHARELRARATLRLRAQQPSAESQLTVAMTGRRRRVDVRGGVVAAPNVCVHAVGDLADCAPTPTPVVSTFPQPPARGTPTAPQPPRAPTSAATTGRSDPTRTSTPDAPATAASPDGTSATPRRRVYLPFARRASDR